MLVIGTTLATILYVAVRKAPGTQTARRRDEPSLAEVVNMRRERCSPPFVYLVHGHEGKSDASFTSADLNLPNGRWHTFRIQSIYTMSNLTFIVNTIADSTNRRYF